MKKAIICIGWLLFLTANYTKAQVNQPSVLGAWSADSSYSVNFKTGKKKPINDYRWFQYTLKPDMTGDMFWDDGTDGGDVKFTWAFSITDSILKLTFDNNKLVYWKFNRITDTTIHLVSYQPNTQPKTGIERKMVNNYIILGKLVLYSDSSNILTFPNPVRSMVTVEYVNTAETFPVTNELLSINLHDANGKEIKCFMSHEKVYSDADTKKRLDFTSIPPAHIF